MASNEIACEDIFFLRKTSMDSQATKPHLRLYLDTADVKQWQTWLPTGLFYGVTCNPILLQQADIVCQISSIKALTQQALQLGAQEVHMQAWGSSTAALYEVGQALGSIDPKVIVKIPATQIGTAAASKLIQNGIPITITAVYAVHQVLIAAAIGARYAAPYLGRINDLGRTGRTELAMMQEALNGVNSTTRLLTASIREVEDISFFSGSRR